MGKLDVTILRYLTKEDFRILTAVSRWQKLCHLLRVEHRIQQPVLLQKLYALFRPLVKQIRSLR